MISFRDQLDTAKSFLGIHDDGPNRLEKVRLGFVGGHENPAGENLDSLTILYCAVQQNLTVGQTLEMFGEHLESVNADPDGYDHANIRALMKHNRQAYVGSFVSFERDPIVSIKSIIEEAWERRADIAPGFANEKDREAVSRVLGQLNRGVLRVASKDDAGNWQVHEWIKKAVLLSFRIYQNRMHQGGRPNVYFDKVDTKFNSWTEADFQQAGFRVVSGAVARTGSYIGKGVILMPSFVNIGAYVDSGTMVDTWATVGSCAQIGKNVHLSGGVGIGGVLEPLQANPTIIEDNCFIGARSEVVEGVIVGEGSVLGMGVFLGQSTPVWHREKRQWLDASAGLKIPPYSVVISGQKPAKNPDDPTTYSAVIVKTVDAQTRSKTSINDLLRD